MKFHMMNFSGLSIVTNKKRFYFRKGLDISLQMYYIVSVTNERDIL